MRRKFKFLILLMTTLILTGLLNVKASSGYTYDHNGQPIYSATGLTINQLPYLAGDLGIKVSDFKAPEDLFIYKGSNETTIYIVDSSSNKLFVFNDSFELRHAPVETFKVDVSKFTDAVLNEIKSGGKYVIARDVLFSIPSNFENINLEVGNSLQINYELHTSKIDYDYEIVWATSNSNVEIEVVDGVVTINSKEVGITDITGTLKKISKQEVNGVEETVITDVETIKIKVSTDPDQPLTSGKKHNGYSINELKTVGSFDLHLNGVVGSYRAINPNTGEDLIYLLDKDNNQVVIVDAQTYEVVQFVTTPNDITFETKKFAPKKLVTDGAGRMYIIADNVNEGIMQFSKNGEFNSFVGVNYVTLTPWEIFWRNLSTDEQLAKQTTIINTSFTSLAVDSRGFIYTTSYALTNSDGLVTNDKSMIKKINTAGKDVLRRNGYQPPMGDVTYVQSGTEALVKGPSKFAAIAVNDHGMYTVLDKKMGRLFTYDNEGRLLYVSGDAMYIEQGKGQQINTLSNPVAMSYLGDKLVVLDKNSSAILIYEPTDIGAIINEAAKLEFAGDSKAAAIKWEQVVKLNANYEYGYVGIGKMYLNEKDYKSAMKYFQRGANRELYSKAYKLYRDGKIRKLFGPVMGTAIVLIVGKVVLDKFVFKKKRNDEDSFKVGDDE